MDVIREMVSNRKIRFKEDDFNLDLTYITDRIIAMAYPASGFEALYRNRIDDVSKLMSQRHISGFLIVNASNKKYDFQKFDNNVYSIVWPNHFPCPMYTFLIAVLDTIDFMIQNPEKVIAIHCKAGKGRTGSLTCAILFISGNFKSIEETNEFYYKQRAVNVTLPSQMRYLKYYTEFVDKGNSSLNFKAKRIDSIRLISSNKGFIKGGTYKVKFRNFAAMNEVLASSILNGNSVTVLNVDKQENIENSERFISTAEVGAWKDHAATDILITLKRKGLMKNKKLFRANFSMLKIKDNSFSIKYADVEKPKGLPEDFEMIMGFVELSDGEVEKNMEGMFTVLETRMEKLKEIQKSTGFADMLLNGNRKMLNPRRSEDNL